MNEVVRPIEILLTYYDLVNIVRRDIDCSAISTRSDLPPSPDSILSVLLLSVKLIKITL